MINLDVPTTVYVGAEPIDFRKQIDGVALCVQEVLALDPYSPSLFLFRNRIGDKVKLLYWHHNGFVLLYKRLEKNRFHWPVAQPGHSSIGMTLRELGYLLEGGDISDLSDIDVLHYQRV